MAQDLNELKKEMVQEMLEKIFETGYVDDHHLGWSEIPVVVLLRFCGNQVDLCFASEKAQYFSVNPFWLDYESGQIHLLRGSIGGCVDLRGRSLAQAIEKYNKEAQGYEYLLPVRYNDVAGQKAAMQKVQAA